MVTVQPWTPGERLKVKLLIKQKKAKGRSPYHHNKSPSEKVQVDWLQFLTWQVQRSLNFHDKKNQASDSDLYKKMNVLLVVV